MNPARRKLPIGIQCFAKIRERDYYYVDKTPMAWRLAEDFGYYFLSRPRRFGKSLFLDTLAELFEANRALFKGLYIDALWDWSIRYPVIRISFGSGQLQNKAELDRRILDILRVNREQLKLEYPVTDDITASFAEIIRKAHAQFGQRVVILVDEYDKPILDNITHTETATEMREGLKNFYSVIKDMDEHIRFVFITGVSKFSKVSLFSGLNNLHDITVLPEFSAICGYTEKDLDETFAPEIMELSRDEIRHWYNGYNWLGESVYNPFDLLLLFNEHIFRPWWFETGTPTFLIKLLAQRGFFTPDLASLRTGFELLSSFDVEHISPEALLFQTGYLTLKKCEEPIRGHCVYTLGYPQCRLVKRFVLQCIP